MAIEGIVTVVKEETCFTVNIMKENNDPYVINNARLVRAVFVETVHNDIALNLYVEKFTTDGMSTYDAYNYTCPSKLELIGFSVHFDGMKTVSGNARSETKWSESFMTVQGMAIFEIELIRPIKLPKEVIVRN